MATNNLNDNLRIQAPKPTEDKSGYWDIASGSWKPYDSVLHALTMLEEAYRYETQTVPVMVDGKQVEYWFNGGVTDSDFVLKTSPGALVILDDSVAFGTTSSDLDSAYPDSNPGDVVWSEVNQIMFTKLENGKWDYKSLSIA